MAPATVGRPGRLAPRSVNSTARQTPYRERAGVFLARAAPGASNHREEPKMTRRKMSREKELWMAQRAIVLQVLRDDHDPLWTRSELRDEIADLRRRAFNLALDLLEGDGCILVRRRAGREGINPPTPRGRARAGVDLMPGESRVRVPAGVVEVLREMVECGQGAAVVGALREREAFERLRVVESDDPEECRRGRINLRRIWAFLASVGADKRDGVFAVTIPAAAVALVRCGLLGELQDMAGEISDAVGSAGYDEAPERYTEPLKRQDDARALLDVVGWEKVENPRPAAVYLDIHRETLLRAARRDLDHYAGRAADPDASDETRARAEADGALLEKLIAAIGGEA
jgi:hypothetical protein